MGISQVPDQIKRAPAGALRAVFSGIGRILLAADRPGPAPARLRSDSETAPTWPAEQAVPQRAEPRRPAAESRWRSLDQTGNVRLLTPDEIYDDSKPDLSEGADRERPATSRPARTNQAAQAGSGAASAPGLAASPLTLPLADYDSLSLPSIRARLRVLSPDQLRVLADYERKNAERTDVLGMLERRIEKVENAR
jgi:hypothetical protein